MNKKDKLCLMFYKVLSAFWLWSLLVKLEKICWSQFVLLKVCVTKLNQNFISLYLFNKKTVLIFEFIYKGSH